MRQEWGQTMSIDLTALWDFQRPEVSERRFQEALAQATPAEAIILRTQIARTYGLRGDFARARQILAEVAPQTPGAGAEAQVRYYLELGRTYASAAHPPEAQTAEARDQARAAYQRAAALAQQAQLDSLAIDALHMMAFVDTAPEAQVAWDRAALALMQASAQPEATRWAGPLHNNVGYALHQLGRYEEALQEFQLALAAHERGGDPRAIRIAHWMVAWTLRALGRLAEAIEIQLRLERACEAAGEPDPYVFEELELLYRACDKPELADAYAARRQAAQP